MSFLLFSAANAASYMALNYVTTSRDASKSQSLIIAFENYLSNCSRAHEYLLQFNDTFNRIYNTELGKNGLIIKKAFLGHSDHIYHLDTGMIP